MSKEKKYKLSVILPVYNVEKYLPRCLESLINQTSLDDYEIICVNDGSTDNSLEIIKKYVALSDKVKLVSKENGGISSARNEGIKHASGEYIAFIDSDDFVESNYIVKVLSKAKNESSDIVIFDFEYYWGENDPRNYYMVGLKEGYDHLDNKHRSIISSMFVWNKIFRKEFFLNENIRFVEGTWYEDIEVASYLSAKADKISYVNECLLHYQQRETSIMGSRSKKNEDLFDVMERVYSIFKNNNLLEEYNDELCYLMVEQLLLYGQFRFLVMDNYKELVVKARDIVSKYYKNYLNNKYIRNLSKKYRFFIRFNNEYTCSLFRKYLLRSKNG